MIDPIVFTERDLFAIIGELYVRQQMKDLELAQLRAEVQSLSVVESPEQEVADADGKP